MRGLAAGQRQNRTEKERKSEKERRKEEAIAGGVCVLATDSGRCAEFQSPSQDISVPRLFFLSCFLLISFI